ncbi:MAG TPA: DUF4157 domain-containing protein [Anaerolineae bacterium]|nr:DUF4157 domain-containing protein [Anaerolineae bacterium]HQI83712.1 DUF4157 domain-containing protein [Anaerolineae bacterium]
MAAQTRKHCENVKKQSVRGRDVKPTTAIAPIATAQAARALADPAPLQPEDALALQRTAGNRAVTGLLQTKLLQRQPEEEEIQTKRAQTGGGFTVDAETERRLTAGKGKGRPLPADVRAFMEARFGADLSGVQLHTDSNAEQLNRALSAQAFTHGKDIYLGAGKSDVTTATGQRLLAHELTHVIQQGAVKPTRPRQGQQSRKSACPASVPQTTQTHERVQRVLNPLEWWKQAKEGKKGVKEGKTKKEKAGTVIEALAGGLQGDQREEVTMAGLYGATMSGPEGKEFKPTGKFSEFLDQDAPSGLMNATYVAQGAGQTLSGIMGMGKGIKQQFSGSRFQQHTGAKGIEKGVSDILGGATSAGGGIESLVGDSAKTLVKMGGENIPILDVVYNYTLAGLKGKEAVEDTAMATAMGVHSHQLEKKKRGALHNLPGFNRRQFMEEWNAKQAYRRLQQSGTRMQKLKYALAHPGLLTSKPSQYFKKKAENKAGEQLKQQYKQERQDVRVLEQKAKMGQDLSRTEQTKISAFKDKYRSYEGYREAQKTAKFIGKRKAESATVKGIEATGYALDATGTFTAAGDLGATKATGKLLKFGASAYKGLRTLGARAKKVHGLRKAKNLFQYGGKSDRGIGWGMKQFFFGNVDKQREKLQSGIDEPNKVGNKFYAPGKKINEEYGGRGWDRGYNRWVAERKMLGSRLALDGKTSRWARIGALAEEKNKAEYGGKKDRGLGWKLRQYLRPGSVTAKSTGFRRALTHGTTGKAMDMTPEKAVTARRLVTTSGERRGEQLLKGLQSSDPEVQKEHLRIYNTMAGGSLGGALSLAHRGLAKPEDIAKWQTDEKLAKEDQDAIKKLFEKETSL